MLRVLPSAVVSFMSTLAVCWDCIYWCTLTSGQHCITCPLSEACVFAELATDFALCPVLYTAL